jgi:hypothetical protein
MDGPDYKKLGGLEEEAKKSFLRDTIFLKQYCERCYSNQKEFGLYPYQMDGVLRGSCLNGACTMLYNAELLGDKRSKRILEDFFEACNRGECEKALELTEELYNYARSIVGINEKKILEIG